MLVNFNNFRGKIIVNSSDSRVSARRLNRIKRKKWVTSLMEGRQPNDSDNEDASAAERLQKDEVDPQKDDLLRMSEPLPTDEEDISDGEVPEHPNPMLMTGKKLIAPLSNKFCAKRYTGRPLEEMDDYYRYRRVSDHASPIILNTRTPAYGVEKSLSVSGVVRCFFERSYRTLSTVGIE